jgi:hypothetical protein
MCCDGRVEFSFVDVTETKTQAGMRGADAIDWSLTSKTFGTIFMKELILLSIGNSTNLNGSLWRCPSRAVNYLQFQLAKDPAA